MFFACGIWCLADVSSVSPPSELTSPEWCQRDGERELSPKTLLISHQFAPTKE